MEKFFFTYGTEGQPYYGGWTEVIAPDRELACAAFRAIHPDKHEGYLNCSSVYSAADFNRTTMAGPKGNFHKFCHETITMTVEAGS